jgi:D-apiose dehydrogenase
MPEELRFAIFGTGFWAQYQLAAWNEVPGARCVALYNRTRAKAETLAQRFAIPAVYDDAEQLLQNEQLDFVDIITDVDSHRRFVELAFHHGLPAICQKPLAPTLADGEAMVAASQRAHIPFYVHENWRWQTPIRALQALLEAETIGKAFRARLSMVSGFPVFANQPFLGELEQFIITDMGSHILDVARFLFGEAQQLYCQTHRVHSTIRGEDVATIMLAMGDTTVTCELGYAENPLERECFPQTLIFIEGAQGSLELSTDYLIRLTTSEGTLIRRYPPPRYSWADPAYDVVHASIVPCNANLLAALQGKGQAETTGEDNLRTARLVFAAYDSAASGQAVQLADNN